MTIANPTNATSVVFSVDFSQDVTERRCSRLLRWLLLGSPPTATVTVGNAGDSDASTYTVTVDTISGDGTLGLDIAGGNNITDHGDQHIGHVTDDRREFIPSTMSMPTVSITRDDANPINANSVVFSVDFERRRFQRLRGRFHCLPFPERRLTRP